ncbi:MAG: HEPN domain-containing protein [Thermoguttaceae bacterium]|jgi:HEPN domain-containing protein
MQSAELARLLLRKAKQDQYALNRLLDDPAAPDEVIGFHAQQAVEKMSKAVLALNAIDYRRTHQLEELTAILDDSGISYPPELSEAIALTPFAVEFRYDLLPVHDDACPLDRQWAKRCVERIGDWASSVVPPEDG